MGNDMTIETKYNVGDKAWFVESHGELTEARVTGMSISVLLDGHVMTTYSMAKKYGHVYFWPEEKLFPTKEELLKSLQYDV